MNYIIRFFIVIVFALCASPVLAHSVPQEVFDALPCSETPCEIDGAVYDNLAIYPNVQGEWMIVYFEGSAAYKDGVWAKGHIVNTHALGNSRYNTVLNSINFSPRQFYTFSDGQLHTHPPYAYVYHWEADPTKCISEWYSTVDLFFLRYSYHYDRLPFIDPGYFCGQLKDVAMGDLMVSASDPVSTDGASSVLFLPGHPSSVLQASNQLNIEKLWPGGNDEAMELVLDDDGGSVRNDIYENGVVIETYGTNIYKDFIKFLNDLRSEGIVVDAQPYPYDWRLPLDTLVNDEVVERIEALARDSHTGKVTLIGHSNGGLFGKLLIEELEKRGKSNLVDRLIMIGSPQLGTPKAVAGLLHGEGFGPGGIVLADWAARTLAENMVSAYTLLPFREYFEYVEDPVVEFDTDVAEIYDFPALYGSTIDTVEEMYGLVLGDNGERSEPSDKDTDSPNVLDNDLLSEAIALQERLIAWQPPEGLQVVQIAGWGLDTIRGVRYDDCDIVFCPDNLSNLDHEPIFTHDGDKTVVILSAIGMEGKADVETYYVDLSYYNEGVKRNRDHKNLTEVKPIRDLIRETLKQEEVTLSDYIKKEKPFVNDEDKRLRFSMHSPVALHLYSGDLHTGITEKTQEGIFYEEHIPNSYYMEMGEGKYAGMPGDIDGMIKLTGESLGAFTFEVERIVGGENEKTIAFADIPVSENLTAEISIDDGEIGGMEMDIDGDGEADVVLEAGEEISKETLIEILTQSIDILDTDEKLSKKITKDLAVIKKHYAKEKTEHAGDEKLENLQSFIEHAGERGDIEESFAKEIINVLERIKLVKK